MNEIKYTQVLLHGLGRFPIVARLKKRKFLLVDHGYFSVDGPDLITVNVVGCFFIQTLPKPEAVMVDTARVLALSGEPAIEAPTLMTIDEWIDRR